MWLQSHTYKYASEESRRNEETGSGIMENDRVRVLGVLFKPNDKAVMHSHPDHVVYVLKGGKLKLTSSEKTDVLDLKTGQAMFFKAQSHEAENTGKTDVDLLVVELKK